MNYPIVLVPGLLGSMGDDIVRGTGDFSFGLAQYAYKPILKNFEEMGFKKDKDLFVAFYDWRKGNQLSAEEYLIPIIEKAKVTSKSKKVNLICHSMGGLVARAYIQSGFYKYDVDNLILIGTPNAGSAKAYYYWEGGIIPSNDGFSNLFYNILWEGFIWLHKIFSGVEDNLTIKRELIPSIKELLPCREYGNFLFTINSNNYGEFIPQDKMVEQNTFLNDLNQRMHLIYRRRVKVHLISGNGVRTEKFIRVRKNRHDSLEWADGIPDYVVYSDSGDGTVTDSSVTAIYGNVSRIKGDHLEILKGCKDTLASILNKRGYNRRPINNTQKKHSLCTVLAKNVKKIFIESKGRKVDIREFSSKNYRNVIVNNIGENISGITINLEEVNNAKLTFIPKDNTVSYILVIKRSDNNDLNERREIQTEEVFTLDI